MMNLGIYIHIPFCIKKCSYCDFVSFETNNYDEYFNALSKEIELYKDFISERKIDTVFIGGGTPSVVNPYYIEKILSKFNITGDTEVTIETNPKTLTDEKLKKYLDIGINRISIGMQSANDNELKSLGRIHNFNDFLKSYELTVNAGFKNINIDTMFGIPGQTTESFKRTLKEIKKLNPTHISSYSLIIEEGTPFYKMELDLPKEDDERKMYELLSKELFGYKRYEISNFAKEGFECRHNLKYWTFEDYLGLGLNSHSFIKDTRFFNTNNMAEYINQLLVDKKPVLEYQKEEKEELLSDFIITGLRLEKGIKISKVNRTFEIDFCEKYKDIIEKYSELGMLKLDNDSLSFTEKGFSISNYILSDFI